jgi:hypothetical protein
MMLNSSALLAHVRNFVAQGGEVDERVDSLILRGPFPTSEEQAAWLALAAAVATTQLSLQLYNPAIGGDLTVDDAFDPARTIVITITKPSIMDVACFFLQNQLTQYWLAGDVAARLLIADLDIQEEYTTRGFTVAHWDLDATIIAPPVATRIDPTPFVRDFVPVREISTDISPWFLITPPSAPSAAFTSWKGAACRRLLGSVVSSAWLENDVVWLQASGPPLFRVRADSSDIVGAFDELTEAAHWVFLSGQDIEARHIIFASELARANRPDQTFIQTMARALDAAKATYEAHVQSSSRETLKALSDLRKTVIDETQKVAQKTQDLTASLWRDLAVTAAPFVLKILGDAGKVENSAVAAGFYFAAATFIILSFVLQWRINHAFFEGQSASRASWMQTLYNYISTREREEIAVTPIEMAIKNYRETRTVLAIVYAILFMVLMSFGGYTLWHSGETVPSQTPTQAKALQTQNQRQTTTNTPRCMPTLKSPCPQKRP